MSFRLLVALGAAGLGALGLFPGSSPSPPEAAPPGQLQETPWAFTSPRRPALPKTQNRAWESNPIDAFILARLEENQLAPSPRADRLTLLRRVTVDLTGLPPSLAEQEAFLADETADAYEKVVDRLLASPRYGERW